MLFTFLGKAIPSYQPSPSFPAFFQSILKDIRMERPKIRETDNLRALYIATFFIEFFTLSRERAPAETKSEWDFGYIAEFTEIDSIKWVVSRMRIVMDDRVCPLLAST